MFTIYYLLSKYFGRYYYHHQSTFKMTLPYCMYTAGTVGSNPSGAWMFVSCEFGVLSGIGLFDELITPPKESYQLWFIVVCDLETSRTSKPWPALGRSATGRGGGNISLCLND
jgi:hypothetical protein